jgi:hypothetical protein
MNVATSGVVCLFMFLFSYKHFKIGDEWKGTMAMLLSFKDVGTEIMNLFMSSSLIF